MFFSILKSLIMVVIIALMVGFFTLVERKVLSYIQIRKGPNKVGFMGLPQPLSDAAKLLTKESYKTFSAFKLMYFMSPVLGLIVMFLLWSLLTSTSSMNMLKLGMLFFICISSLNVYIILGSGWSSNSKYALLGAIRGVAQTISYEISMALVIMTVLILLLSFNLKLLWYNQYLWLIFIIAPSFYMWFVSSLAETNRAPFDLAEGESELVSGFNIEYGGGPFAFLFIAEYGSILLMSIMTSVMFLSGSFTNLGISNTIKAIFFSFCFLWVRGSYPRMRYDTLMSLTWKIFLPCSIIYLLFIMSMMY